jgi:lipopolysaccharide biosynthesis protein
MPKPRIITFYLPQYHPIPENDEWWGKGFTDWRNVVKGKPRFKGHYQPQLPSDLGFYDLRLEQTRSDQAALAKSYGISAFCYYHYWFNGKMLLEKPFDDVLASGKPDIDFCLCWANENWTRRWDGLENEILIQQDYQKYDPVKHFEWLLKAFNDKRYLRIKNKPLFIIYNVSGIPALNDKIKTWRKLAAENGFDGIYICSVKSIHNKSADPEHHNEDIDAFVDFIPNNEILKYRKLSGRPKYHLYSLLNKLIDALGLENKITKFPLTYICDYKKIAEYEINKPPDPKITFPCVIPNWDNSSRKRNSTVIQNNGPEEYTKWLNNALKKAAEFDDEEQLVFVNAWNEWAEGCHLEPDIRNGKMFLEATLKALENFKNDK